MIRALCADSERREKAGCFIILRLPIIPVWYRFSYVGNMFYDLPRARAHARYNNEKRTSWDREVNELTS